MNLDEQDNKKINFCGKEENKVVSPIQHQHQLQNDGGDGQDDSNDDVELKALFQQTSSNSKEELFEKNAQIINQNQNVPMNHGTSKNDRRDRPSVSPISAHAEFASSSNENYPKK